MRFFVLFIFLCSVFSRAYTQVNTAETNANLQTASQGLGIFKAFDNRSKQPDGSTRVFETYQNKMDFKTDRDVVALMNYLDSIVVND